MSKSVYSLVLNDQLVAMLDKVAYKKGMSRSNLINTIIADYLSYETPEKRMQHVFKRMEDLVAESQSLKFMPQPSASFASIYSAISFRYKPTVRYGIELFSAEQSDIGELKVYLRTTNAQLLMAIENFFLIFCKFEQKHLGNVQCSIVDGRLTRRLRLFEEGLIDNVTLGDALIAYVKNFDALLNVYFAQLNAGVTDYAALEEEYLQRLRTQSVVFQ